MRLPIATHLATLFAAVLAAGPAAAEPLARADVPDPLRP